MKHKGMTNNRILLVVLISTIMLCFLFYKGEEAFADDTHLADVPLEVRGKAAPAVVNVLWDASGSMLFSTFTDEWEGLFRIGDNLYMNVFEEGVNHDGISPYFRSSGDGCGSVEGQPSHINQVCRTLPQDKRNYWKATCATANTMYYNPDFEYTPWTRWTSLDLDPYYVRGSGPGSHPFGEATGGGWIEPGDHDELDFGGEFHADIDNPRRHPTKPHLFDEPTFNLNEEKWIDPDNDDHPDIEFEPAEAEKIIRYAHYYVENDNGVFLVHLDNEITYYKAELCEDRLKVEKLIHMTNADAESAGIVSGRTYLEERQNFANWYQFYRLRYLAGIAAAGEFIDGWSNIFLSFQSFPEENPDTGEDHFKLPEKFYVAALDMIIRDDQGNEEYYNEKDESLWVLYTMPHPYGGTPMREALYKSGQFFEEGGGWSALHGFSVYHDKSGTHLYPYFYPEYGGDCQQAFAVMMTDGWYNDGDFSPGVGNRDRDGNDPFVGEPYADGYSDTLADIAMYFYDRDLKPQADPDDHTGLANYVPRADFEHPDATHQRQILYGITFGADGKYTDEERQRFTESLRWGDEPDDSDWEGWPKPVASTRTTVDDLWHATINSRGEFFSANNPEALIDAMRRIHEDIMKRIGTGAAVTASTVERRTETMLFKGEYDAHHWSGDLVGINNNDVVEWRAAEKLDLMNWEDRNILTKDGDFSASNVDLTEEQVEYLRGNRDLEQQNGGPFRTRNSRLGDIVNSEPEHRNGVVYVGANDGMLHAFDAETGEELFAYVPELVHDNLHKLTDPEFTYQFFVNGSPVARNAGGKTILVCGLRKGGKGYFALDVSDPENMSHENVKWEFTDADLGYTYGRPAIRRIGRGGDDGTWVAIFGNGYNSINGEAVLYVVNLETGKKVHKFRTGAIGSNGIVGDIAAIDSNRDGFTDYVYAGDLKGNLWKFNLTDDNWGIAYNDKPLITARNENGNIQPITSAPTVMHHCNQEGYIVIFGTGKLASELDFGNHEKQYVYGIWDWEDAWDDLPENAKHFGHPLGTGNRELSNLAEELSIVHQYSEGTLGSGESLEKAGGIRYNYLLNDFTIQEPGYIITTIEGQTGDEEYIKVSDNEVDWWDPLTGEGEHVGWYFELPDTGERVTANPRIRTDHVHFLGIIPTDDPCMAGGTSNRYVLNACEGREPSRQQFFRPTEENGNGNGNGNDNDNDNDIPIVNGNGDDPPIQREDTERIRSGTLYWHEW